MIQKCIMLLQNTLLVPNKACFFYNGKLFHKILQSAKSVNGFTQHTYMYNANIKT